MTSSIYQPFLYINSQFSQPPFEVGTIIIILILQKRLSIEKASDLS